MGGHVYSARVAVGSDAYSGSSIIGRYDVESDTAFLWSMDTNTEYGNRPYGETRESKKIIYGCSDTLLD